MTSRDSLPDPPPALLQSCLDFFRRYTAPPGAVSLLCLAPSADAIEPISLPRSLVEVAGQLAPTLSPELASVWLQALRQHYSLPGLTWPQLHTFFAFAQDEQEIITAELNALPIEILPNGDAWTNVRGYPARWRDGMWCVQSPLATQFRVPTLRAALLAVARLRREQYPSEQR